MTAPDVAGAAGADRAGAGSGVDARASSTGAFAAPDRSGTSPDAQYRPAITFTRRRAAFRTSTQSCRNDAAPHFAGRASWHLDIPVRHLREPAAPAPGTIAPCPSGLRNRCRRRADEHHAAVHVSMQATNRHPDRVETADARPANDDDALQEPDRRIRLDLRQLGKQTNTRTQRPGVCPRQAYQGVIRPTAAFRWTSTESAGATRCSGRERKPVKPPAGGIRSQTSTRRKWFSG